jgi:hypothetical protein
MRRLILLCSLLAGCGLFTGGDDDHMICPVSNEGDQPAEGFIDPSTGVCDYITTTCDPDPSDNCACAPTAGIAQPEGGECYGPCASLDEQDCLSNDTCHAAYLEGGSGAQFWACWDITPQTPQDEGACTGLDAYTCAVDPSCASLFDTDANGNTDFTACITAGSGCNCGSGASCEYECPNDVACPAGSDSCGGCVPVCVPNNPVCNLTCPSGDVCMEACSPNGTCTAECVSSSDPGQCTGQILCNMAPPQCPSGTTAGILNNCYTGYCIPDADCAPEDCAAITDEATCSSRSDCEAVYMGSNCTCDDSGCTCTTLTFERCEDLQASGSGG